MINQLLSSNEEERRKRNKKKTVQYYSEIDHNPQIPQSKRFKDITVTNQGQQSDMPIRLISPIRGSGSSDGSIWDIQQSVRDKLRQKQIFLPNIPVSPKNNMPAPQHKSFKKAKKSYHRFKTQANEGRTDNETELDEKYDNTIVEIKQMNHNFQRDNLRKKHSQNLRNHRNYYSDQYSSFLDDSRMSRRERFSGSRQKEFQKYVDYLEDKYWQRGKMYKKGLMEREKEREIGKKLESRVQTRKRWSKGDFYEEPNMQQSKMTPNREAIRALQQEEEYISKIRESSPKINNHPKYNTLNTNDNSRGNVENSRYNNSSVSKKLKNHESESLQYTRVHPRQQQLRKLKQNHNNFIKVLRMAKNRGQSLLVKLQKYPYQPVKNKKKQVA